jgi:serine phosphatase RsbU (regulator of sigma subunit)
MKIDSRELERVIDTLEGNKIQKYEIPKFGQFDIAIKDIPFSSSGMSGDFVDIYNYNTQYSLKELTDKYMTDLFKMNRLRNSLPTMNAQDRVREHFDTRISGIKEALRQLRISKHRLGILIADAVGHDLASAITATKIKHILRSFITSDIESYGQVTGRALNRSNTRLFRANLRHMKKHPKRNRETASLIFGDLFTDKFSYLSLAHPQPLYYCYEFDEFLQNTKEDFEENKLFRLGEFPSIDCFERFPEPLVHAEKYAARRIDFVSAGILFLYTDGLEELMGSENFIETRVKPIFAKTKSKSAFQISNLIKKEVSAYLSDNRKTQKDDILFLIIKRQ